MTTLTRTKTDGGPWSTTVEEAEAGGGDDLPDWWTVDSTPEAGVLTMGGQLTLEPGVDNLYALLINLPADFDNNANARIVLYNEFGQKCLQYDSGGLDMTANDNPTNEGVKVHMSKGNTEGIVSPDLLSFSVDNQPWLFATQDSGLKITPSGGATPLTLVGLPAADPGVPGQLYHTAGAVKVSL